MPTTSSPTTASPTTASPMTARPTTAPARNLALVTGASGGIGEAIAREFAKRGYDLVLVARSEDKLRRIGEELHSAHGANAHVITADLALPGAGSAMAAQLRSDGLDIDVLVNNAGFADFGEFRTADLAKTMAMISLNIATLTELTRELLPAMVARRRGCLLNVASTAAFMPGPLMAVYYATKAYVLSFSEAIHEELRGTGVTVTALCPGPTESGFQAAAAMEDSKLVKGRKIMSAEKVAEIGVGAALRGRPVAMTGLKHALQAITPKFLPRRVVPAFVKWAQKAN